MEGDTLPLSALKIRVDSDQVSGAVESVGNSSSWEYSQDG